MRFSHFSNTFDNHPCTVETTFSEFAVFLAEEFANEAPATEKEKKHHTPLISPAAYAEDSVRANENVLCYGGWFAIDADTGTVPVEEIVEYLRALEINFVVYTTTSSKPEHHKYRVVFELDRDVSKDEVRQFWHGASIYFGGISDPQTKDPSRMFYVPRSWIGAHQAFEFEVDGKAVNVDEVIALAPEPEPIQPIVPITPRAVKQIDRIREMIMRQGRVAGPTGGKSIPSSATLYSSPVVNTKFVETYCTLPKGEHHVGLFSFMYSVACRALVLGYEIDANHLIDYAKQLDNIAPIKTNKARWSRIRSEAERALAKARARATES